MLELKNVSFSYDPERPVVKNISITVNDGETVGLIGANGAGKSTIMKLILGLLSGTGEILCDGIPVRKDTLSDIRKKIGFVLQDSDDQMFMPTVYEDMIFGPMNYGASRQEADARVDGILAQLGLTDLKYRRNHMLSGGEKRMAAIATILAMQPDIILMDEPTAALDPYNRRIVINTINGLSQTRLITSHDLDMILDTCDRVILLSSGEVVADGPAESILSDRELLEKNRMELPFCLAGRHPAKRS